MFVVEKIRSQNRTDLLIFISIGVADGLIKKYTRIIIELIYQMYVILRGKM